MIAPGFESHQCQEVGRCRTRGESQGMCNVTHMPPLSLNKVEPTLALKPRGDVTRSPKEGYQWPHKKESCPPKNFFKKHASWSYFLQRRMEVSIKIILL